MAIYELDGVAPSLHETAWVAEDAQVIGRVEMGPESSVWHGCVLRGDSDLIRIGAGTNVQDASVLHADFGVPLTLEDRVSIGHKVMLHGCTIGAGSLVTEGKEFPDGSMILGSPAKVVRTLSPEQIAGLNFIVEFYINNAKRFRKGLKRIG